MSFLGHYSKLGCESEKESFGPLVLEDQFQQQPRRIILLDFLNNGETVTRAYCTALLKKLNQKFVERRAGKLAKGVLFLQENTFAHKSSIEMTKIN